MFGVLRYVDSVSVVCDGDGAVIADFEFDTCDGESVRFCIADCLLLANEMIATIDGAFIEEFGSTLCILMEYADGGDLAVTFPSPRAS